VKTRRAGWLLATAMIAFAPFGASAQQNPQQGSAEVNQVVSVRDRPRPEFDPLGIRLGGFTLNGQVDLSATNTDNLFASASGAEQDDVIFLVSPSVRLRSDWPRHELNLEAGADFRSHSDFSSEDSTSGYVGARGRLDVRSSTNLGGYVRLAQEVEPRTNPDALTFGDPVEITRETAGLSAEHRFNRVRVRGGLDWGSFDFDDSGLIDQDFRDYDRGAVTGRVQVEVSPRIGALAQVILDEREYDSNPLLDSNGQTYLVGLSIDWNDLLRGEVSLGQFNRDYDSGTDVSGTAIAATLDWYVTRLTTLQFDASRAAEDTGATTVSPYVQSEVGARVDHELLRNVLLNAAVRFGRREYEVIDRDDDYTSLQLGADYLLNRRVALFGRYNLNETESDGLAAYRDYDVNAFTVGVSLRL
jgi:hypothetical protein